MAAFVFRSSIFINEIAVYEWDVTLSKRLLWRGTRSLPDFVIQAGGK